MQAQTLQRNRPNGGLKMEYPMDSLKPVISFSLPFNAMLCHSVVCSPPGLAVIRNCFADVNGNSNNSILKVIVRSNLPLDAMVNHSVVSSPSRTTVIQYVIRDTMARINEIVEGFDLSFNAVFLHSIITIPPRCTLVSNILFSVSERCGAKAEKGSRENKSLGELFHSSVRLNNKKNELNRLCWRLSSDSYPNQNSFKSTSIKAGLIRPVLIEFAVSPTACGGGK